MDGLRAQYTCLGQWTPEFEKMGRHGNIVLSGYFQDVRYWGEYAADVRTLIAQSIGQAVKQLDPEPVALPEDTGAIHVRGSDYLRNSETRTRQLISYYRTAARSLLAKTGVNRLLVFTDDPAFARETLGDLAGPNVHVQTPDTRLGGLADLWRMATARHLAIANSTYSWWSGMLAQPTTHVIAPSTWPRWCIAPAKQLLSESWELH